PFGPPPPGARSPFYPQPDPALVAEAHKHATFARELIAHTPRTFVYHVIIAINVLVYVAFGLKTGGWVEPSGVDMLAWGADKWELTTSGQWWRLLTSAFLHFGPIHLLANMYALLVVGNLAERLYGNLYFALLYLLSALLSGLASVWWDRAPDGTGAISAGASGAVFAVYGAVIAFICARRGSFPKAAAAAVFQSAVVFVGVNVAFGLSQSGISNAAHLGGLASGLALGAILARPIEREARRRQALPRLAAGVGAAVAALAVAITLIPKASTDARAEMSFGRARTAFLADEQRANDAWDALIGPQGMVPEGDAEFSRKAREIAAMWDGALARLTAVPVPPGSPNRVEYNLFLAYGEARRDAMLAYADGRFRDARKFQKNGDEAVRAINARGAAPK
ncbi:MAG TPA: rhomboid family intramembrane serine protease, partial [Tepidisphaeraceae bacterium]|nr:rhomboid family intramembrane serine protease [Tepidisphaeraceae bacterium]